MAHPEEKANSYLMREMRTMAEALDCLISGDLDRAGDIMVQRFKALEASKGVGGWSIGQQYELTRSGTS
eukprot:5002731-Heterocapsa_arctica.AAC.1